MSTLDIQPLREAEAPAPKGKSALDRIGDIYAEAKKVHRLTVPIPQNPLMGVRYRPFEDDEQIGEGAKTAVEVSMDMLIAACECIVFRDGDGWEPVRADDGSLVRFDDTLARKVGAPSIDDGGSARQTLLKVFSKVPAPRGAIVAQAERLSEWMTGEGEGDDEAALGKS